MGRMSEKSRVIVRTFERKGVGASVWLIADNPTEDELEAIKKVTGARVVRVEKISDYLPSDTALSPASMPKTRKGSATDLKF
jgi:preprotein translocase subunit Sss1